MRTVVTALAVVWAALAALLFGGAPRFSVAAVERACGAPAPDVVLAPSGDAVRSFVAGCGGDGLAAWRDLQVVDLLYPAVTAGLLAGLVLLLARRLGAGGRVRTLALLAVPVALGDYLENAGAWVVLATHRVPDAAAVALQVGSAVKNAGSWAAWTVVLVLLAATGGRAAARRVRAGRDVRDSRGVRTRRPHPAG